MGPSGVHVHIEGGATVKLDTFTYVYLRDSASHLDGELYQHSVCI